MEKAFQDRFQKVLREFINKGPELHYKDFILEFVSLDSHMKKFDKSNDELNNTWNKIIETLYLKYVYILSAIDAEETDYRVYSKMKDQDLANKALLGKKELNNIILMIPMSYRKILRIKAIENKKLKA